jgi:hypothetical protein
MKVYNRYNKPEPSPDDPSFSVDVIVMTKDGVLNIGFFNYDLDKWLWHTDTSVDMEELIDGEPVEFNWIYPVKELSEF